MRQSQRNTWHILTSNSKRLQKYFLFTAVLMSSLLYVSYKLNYQGKTYKLPLNNSSIFTAQFRELQKGIDALKENLFISNFSNLFSNTPFQLKVDQSEYVKDAIVEQINVSEYTNSLTGTIKSAKLTAVPLDIFLTDKHENEHKTTTEDADLKEIWKEFGAFTAPSGVEAWFTTAENTELSNYGRDKINEIKENTESARQEFLETEGRIETNTRSLKYVSKFRPPSLLGGFRKHISPRNELSQPKLEGSRPDLCANCFKTDFPEILNTPNLCSGPVDLFIAIESTLDKHWARKVIRDTWGNVCNKPNSTIKCAFFFGNKNIPEMNKWLRKESDKYKDVVQYDFVDTYANLTYKTITALKWSTKFCSQAKYVMKTDDDMYVNTELLPYLLEAAPNKKLIGGHCWGASSPHREASSKWYVSFKQYAHPAFPAMCSGTGYIISKDVVEGITEMSANIPFFHLEDVYVAICVKRLGVIPVHIEGFRNDAFPFEPCFYRNRALTSHGFQGMELENVWRQSRTCAPEKVDPKQVYFARNV